MKGWVCLSELTQHSLNCLASMGEVKLRPQVSLVLGSFQYTKHSLAWPILVPGCTSLTSRILST